VFSKLKETISDGAGNGRRRVQPDHRRQDDEHVEAGRRCLHRRNVRHESKNDGKPADFVIVAIK
jgi:hypothetical protein